MRTSTKFALVTGAAAAASLACVPMAIAWSVLGLAGGYAMRKKEDRNSLNSKEFYRAISPQAIAHMQDIMQGKR